jgi:ankyrin repeat protein
MHNNKLHKTLSNLITFGDIKQFIGVIKNSNIDFNSQDIKGNTIYHYMVNEYINSSPERLISAINCLGKSVNLNKKNKRGETPIYLSVKHDCDNILIYLLIDQGISLPIFNGLTMLHVAVKYNSRRSFKILLNYMKDNNISFTSSDFIGRNALHYASIYNNVEMIGDLVLKGLSIKSADSFQMTPLLLAAEHNSFNCISYLLTIAGKSGCYEVVKTDYKGWNIIHYMCNNGDARGLKLLLAIHSRSIKPLLHSKSKDGMTPMDLTNIAYRKLLLQLTEKDKEKQTNKIHNFNAVIQLLKNN